MRGVLVIDDEASVRQVVADTLRQAGVAVRTAASGEEGIALFRRERQKLDAVLVDLTMPGLGGAETLLELRRIDPNIAVILTSGYHEEEARSAVYASVPFIRKPFDQARLLEVLRRSLDQGSTRPM